MNTFDPLIGRQVLKILIVDMHENDEFTAPLAIFFQLDTETGLLVGQDFEHETTTIEILTLEEIRYDETPIRQ